LTIRPVDLSGIYQIESVTADGLGGGTIKLVNPAGLNPNWLIGDLAGAGSSAANQNINMIYAPSLIDVRLDGAYTVTGVFADHIVLDDPESVSADWGYLPGYRFSRTNPLSASIATSNNGNWIGPFIVEDPNTHFLVANVVALQGLYKDDGKNQTAFPISFEIESTPVNLLDVPIGAPESFVGIVDGNADKTKDLRAKTLICGLSTPGRQSVRCRRTTPSDYNFKGNVVDEIKWQDLYGMGPVNQPDFGNVTTIRTRTFATEGALAVKERRLNLLATRKVPIYSGSGITFGSAAATKYAGHILVEVCRDPLLGNRQLGEIDLDSIFYELGQASAYFDDSESTEFGYTFDDDNTSFEEMAHTIAQACFCEVYRRGSLIRMLFERPTEDSTLLFNHRNKRPGSETRSIRFGPLDDNDGVELEYIDPAKELPATIYIPADRSARKPRKVTAHGVRSYRQAYWLAWRIFNKTQFQNTTTEFEALSEAAPTIRSERVLVADNTRADTQDGEVQSQVGLTLTLSQPVDLSNPAGYTIFLQLPDATVDSIAITAGADDNQVVLARAPTVALALDPDLYARTTYQIVPNNSPRSSAFLLTDKTAQDSGNYQLQAVNYSSLYYQNDTLKLWLPFLDAGFVDHSPYGRDGTAAGGATTVMDTDRGKLVYSGAAGRSVTFPAFSPPATNYTKALWIKMTSLAGGVSPILESDTEYFSVTDNTVGMGHPGQSSVQAVIPDLNWHHVAGVWDQDNDELVIYFDGEVEMVQGGAGVGPRAALHQLTAFNGFKGRADELRLIGRALGPAEIKELYRATRI
jgi:hypothetical protein